MESLQTIKKNFVLGNGIHDIIMSIWWPMSHDLIRYNPPWARTFLLLCGVLRLWLVQQTLRLRAAKWTYAAGAVICLRTERTRELGIVYYLLSMII